MSNHGVLHPDVDWFQSRSYGYSPSYLCDHRAFDHHCMHRAKVIVLCYDENMQILDHRAQDADRDGD